MSSSAPDQPDPTRPDAPSARPDDTVDATAARAGTPAQDEQAEAGTAAEPDGGEPAEGAPAGDREAVEEPQDVTLLVDPTRVRRAPRYPVFLWMGALVGVVGGLGFATWLVGVTGSGASLMKPGVYITVVVLATTALCMGVAGLIAVLADRRSLRRR